MTKVMVVVNDNAANVVAALRMLEERYSITYLKCNGHILQFVVSHALKDAQISKVLRAARVIWPPPRSLPDVCSSDGSGLFGNDPAIATAGWAFVALVDGHMQTLAAGHVPGRQSSGRTSSAP